MSGEVRTERRITFSYGVNRNQTRTGFTSFENLHEQVRHETMGEVDIDRREERTVTYTPWAEKTTTSPAIQALLNRSDEYPKNVGTIHESTGFDLTRDELIAILQECSPRVVIGAFPHHYEPSGDGTSFQLTVYATFSRSELDMPLRKV